MNANLHITGYTVKDNDIDTITYLRDTADGKGEVVTKSEGGGGPSIELIELDAAENHKKYFAPKGKAYEAVNVDVPDDVPTTVFSGENLLLNEGTMCSEREAFPVFFKYTYDTSTAKDQVAFGALYSLGVNKGAGMFVFKWNNNSNTMTVDSVMKTSTRQATKDVAELLREKTTGATAVTGIYVRRANS